MGLTLGGLDTTPDDLQFSLEGYCDADWAGDRECFDLVKVEQSAGNLVYKRL